MTYITVYYETTGIIFQKRGSDSLLGFEEGTLIQRFIYIVIYIASKISKGWLGEKINMQKKCKYFQNFKAVGVDIKQNKLFIKRVMPILMCLYNNADLTKGTLRHPGN